ncbi:MAG: glucodextranase DOMON-like domain-containing protein [Bacillota bacterium]
MDFKKIKNKKTKFLILFMLCLFILPITVNAKEARVIFNHLDGIGDDYGPGNYYYPRNHIFQNQGNLFDLKSLTILEKEKEYQFCFDFVKLTDPWGAKYGFSLPLIEIYLDNQAKGSNKLFHKGANISFSQDFYWNKFIKISGWWVRVFNPDSKKENILNINDLSFANPNKIENMNLIKKGNSIYLSLAKKDLGSLKNSKIVVLVGSFDPFGYDHFRSLSKNKDYWKIYSKNQTKIDQAPRVLDILVPRAQSQKEVLKGEMPEVPYLRVSAQVSKPQPTLVDYLMPVNKLSIIILLFYLVAIYIIIYKFKYENKNKN